jgi:8-oxo-dGTP diphosphatase
MKRTASSKKVAKPIPAKPILAAGTITVRDKGRDLEVLVVHRKMRNDFSFPKGKLEADELMPTCAARETFEETTVDVVLRAPIGTIRYKSLGVPKLVRYWLAEPTDEAIQSKNQNYSETWEPNDEVDEILWLKPAKARKLLTYPHDVQVLERALKISPNTRPLVLLRHAEAEKRASFAERHEGNPPHDFLRPLTEVGAAQTPAIAAALRAFGVTSSFSSPADRCISTIAPAFVSSDNVVLIPEVSEFAYAENPSATKTASAKLAMDPAAAVVVCHRPVLPTMVRAVSKALEIDEPLPKLKPGQFIVIHRPIKSNGKLRKGSIWFEHSGEHEQ